MSATLDRYAYEAGRNQERLRGLVNAVRRMLDAPKDTPAHRSAELDCRALVEMCEEDAAASTGPGAAQEKLL